MTAVSEAIDEYLHAKRNLRFRTFRWYKQKLGVFSEWCEGQNLELSQLKAKNITTFLGTLTAESDYTKKGYAQVVKGFLNWCAKEEDYEEEVKSRTIERIELPRVEKSVITIFTADEIKRLFLACEHEESTAQKAKAKAILSILLDTGIRASELALDTSRMHEKTGLRVDMIDLSTIDPHITVYGKGNKQREIGLGDRSRKALKSYVERQRNHSTSEYVFLGRGGEPLSVRGLQQLLYRLADRAKVLDCHPHKFRHTFAVTYLLDSGKEADGAALYRLMRLLGHTDIKTTTIYLRAMEARQIRNGYSVLDNLK